ncbi:hypothetical protein Nepgr_030571 [Nepenthes gracilis]|uniref:Uncharacterized protein n=1 Tax=Nepenthes gracilis TaxID=150966 RepID=A0AAD3TF26_NEPGR|nr:hypothetical protein Nepgr_030571 [Nepenthes gracilis]
MEARLRRKSHKKRQLIAAEKQGSAIFAPCLAAMERLNSELHLRNCCIIRENERLRKIAQLLNQENQALLSELKEKIENENQKAAKQGTAAATVIELNLSPRSPSTSPSYPGKKPI